MRVILNGVDYGRNFKRAELYNWNVFAKFFETRGENYYLRYEMSSDSVSKDIICNVN